MKRKRSLNIVPESSFPQSGLYMGNKITGYGNSMKKQKVGRSGCGCGKTKQAGK